MQVAERWILARLRHETFFSLAALNARIAELLADLNALWTHTKGGFYHDGRFATLADVADHYNTSFTLGLTGPEVADLVEYLKSL